MYWNFPRLLYELLPGNQDTKSIFNFEHRIQIIAVMFGMMHWLGCVNFASYLFNYCLKISVSKCWRPTDVCRRFSYICAKKGFLPAAASVQTLYPSRKTQLYFSVSIDVAKFYVRNSFSVLDRTFETRLRQQPPAGVESGKIGMKI